MKKNAWPGVIGTPEEYGDGLGLTQDGPTKIDLQTSVPSDGLTPEKSVLENMDSEQGLSETTEYAGGIISPVEGSDYNWVLDDVRYKKAQVTIYKGANAPLASFQCGIAESVQDQVIGLQSYKSLDDSAGLLFKYSRPQSVLYHMGTVTFPIDILFVDDENIIKKVYSNIQPGSLATFGCAEIKYVLEIHGGLSSRLGIDTGDMIDIETLSSFLKDATKIAQEVGFVKAAIVTNFKFQDNSNMNWKGFPIININTGLIKTASEKSKLSSTAEFLKVSPITNKVVTAFYIDGLINAAPMVKYYNNYSEVDDSWNGTLDIDIYGRTITVGKGKEKDARLELPYGKDTMVRKSFASFMYMDSNDYYNKEVFKFLEDIVAATKVSNKIIICTSMREPKHLLKMLQHKIYYSLGEIINLEASQILQISEEMDAQNILECISERYPEAKIEIRADNSILKRAGVPVSDDIKKKAKEILKMLDRAIELIEDSLDKMLQNKMEYEKHQDNAEVIEKSKGQFHQSAKRNIRIIKAYLIKIRDAIRIFNDIKDATTTLEIIDGLVSSSKSASDAAEKIFALRDKVGSPDFFMEFSAHTDGYERTIEDLVSSVERAKEYINTNILGMIVLSE